MPSFPNRGGNRNLSGGGSFAQSRQLSKGTTTLSPKCRSNKTYAVSGVNYHPQQCYELVQEGIATHYGEGDNCHGRLTASSIPFNKNRAFAAHRTAVLHSVAKVTNLENGSFTYVYIVDRGPFPSRLNNSKVAPIIDLSTSVAKRLGFYSKGRALVRVEVDVKRSLSHHKQVIQSQKSKRAVAKPTRIRGGSAARKPRQTNAKQGKNIIHVVCNNKSEASRIASEIGGGTRQMQGSYVAVSKPVVLSRLYEMEKGFRARGYHVFCTVV